MDRIDEIKELLEKEGKVDLYNDPKYIGGRWLHFTSQVGLKGDTRLLVAHYTKLIPDYHAINFEYARGNGHCGVRLTWFPDWIGGNSYE